VQQPIHPDWALAFHMVNLAYAAEIGIKEI
jgi:hypothetical protein